MKKFFEVFALAGTALLAYRIGLMFPFHFLIVKDFNLTAIFTCAVMVFSTNKVLFDTAKSSK